MAEAYHPLRHSSHGAVEKGRTKRSLGDFSAFICLLLWDAFRRLCYMLVISLLERLLLGIYGIYSDSPLLLLHQALSETSPEDGYSLPKALSWLSFIYPLTYTFHTTLFLSLLEMFSSDTRSVDSPNPRQSVPLASSPNPLHHLLAI